MPAASSLIRETDNTGHVIAIDGPAGSGKSTVARLVAERLGFIYLDSGALYRAVTLSFLRNGVDVTAPASVAGGLAAVRIHVKPGDNGLSVFLNEEEVTREIRGQEVTAFVSAVSELAAVRNFVNQQLRKIARNFAVVLDGRDIGTVVFPDAALKVFMSASLDERAARRYRELAAAGAHADLDAIKSDIARRDKHDSERNLAPLRPAQDAIVLDTTSMTIDDGVDFIINEYHS